MTAIAACFGAMAMAIPGCASAPPEQFEFPIQKPPLMIPNRLPPRYPIELMASRDTGTVVIRVTVSPGGRPVMSSVEVLSTPHPAFTKAVLAVLPEYRFIPGEIGGTSGDCRAAEPGGVRICTGGRPGKRVAMAVELPFRFELPPALRPMSLTLPEALKLRNGAFAGGSCPARAQASVRILRAGTPNATPGLPGVSDLIVEVRTRTGDPLAMARLTLSSSATSPPLHSFIDAMTDSTGYANIPALPAGGYTLRTRQIGYVPSRDLVHVRIGYTDTVRVSLGEDTCRLSNVIAQPA